MFKRTILGLVLCAGCASTNQLTPADQSDLGVLTAEVALCNTQPDPVACKHAVKVKFDAKRAAKFGGEK